MRPGFQWRIVKGIDHAVIREFKQRFIDLNNQGVNVGLPKDKTEPGKIGAKGTSLALIGAVHEFGSPQQGIPERPWLRPGIRTNKSNFMRLNKINLAKVAKGEMPVKVALGQLGQMAAGAVKKYIRQADNFKPLKPATIKAKGSSAPLIDSGNMIQAITYEITRQK